MTTSSLDTGAGFLCCVGLWCGTCLTYTHSIQGFTTIKCIAIMEQMWWTLYDWTDQLGLH